MIKHLLVASMLAAAADTDGCSSSESHDSAIVDKQQKLYATTQPIPEFKWSQDRDNLIQIYKQKVEARATHAVVRSAGTGEILWDCPSIGFPIPADTQLTNPLQTMGQGMVIEQAEPNGLFTSKNTDGTYVLCVDGVGAVTPQYTEAKVEAFTRPIKVEGGKVVFLDGKPSMTIVIGGH
jgi:hypothetical protein